MILEEQQKVIDIKVQTAANATKMTKMNEINQWYSHVNAVLSSLDGITVETFEINGVILKIKTIWMPSNNNTGVSKSKHAEHSLALYFKPNSSTLIDAKLIPNDMLADDIIEDAIAINDIPYLLFELKLRLSCQYGGLKVF